jgi:D-beta-D-heptose 7-phosphate kinase/D-beta-D-heptose 1-phosphate adenosyltransferase
MKELNLGTHIGAGIFSATANFKQRWIKEDAVLRKLVENCKGLGLKIVLTQGTYDMVHIGHARYFEEAKKYGHILIVGVDSDEKVRARKGPERPVVPQMERLEMVTHLRSVDVVYLKHLKVPRWNLIKIVEPDTLIATKETYTKKDLKELKNYCGEIVVLEPQATTSTSAKIRLLQIGHAKKLEKALTPKLLETIQNVLNAAKDGK